MWAACCIPQTKRCPPTPPTFLDRLHGSTTAEDETRMSGLTYSSSVAVGEPPDRGVGEAAAVSEPPTTTPAGLMACATLPMLPRLSRSS
jgi:hypothetical protein